MTIRRLLTASHLAVVLIFVTICFSVFFWFLYRKSHSRPGHPYTPQMISEFFKETRNQEEVEAFFDSLTYPSHVSLALYKKNGESRLLRGEEPPPPPPIFTEGLLTGEHYVVFHPETKRAEQWIPLSIDGPNSHFLRVGDRRLPDELVRVMSRNFSISCLISMAVILLLAVPIAGALSRPIQKLAELTKNFGPKGYSLRSDIEGTQELRELGHSFNQMADFIEKNTTELREQKEKAEQIEASRRQFLADVSHNLRTPLTAVLGWTDALIDGVAEDENVYRSRIRREVLHASRIVERLLELSRWEQVGPVMRFEEIALADLLLEVAENLQEQAELAGVQLQFEGLDPKLKIVADRQKARDLLQILLENVVEHGGEGAEATVSIEQNDDRVNVTISDTGPGYPKEIIDASYLETGSNEVGNMSLGLAIASRLALAHDSNLELSNRSAGGAKARVGFKLA